MKKIILLFIVSLVALIASCSLGPPNPGFTLVLTRIDEFGFERPLPGIDTTGRLIAAADNASGSIANFHDVSGVSGQIPVPNGRAPGLWALTENNGPCGGQTKNGDIQRGVFNYLPCVRGAFPFNFSPSSINADAPPATFDITGSGMNAVYGMPTVQFRNYLGTLVAKVRATSIVQGRITASATALRSFPTGTYSAQVWNATSNRAGKLVGTATMRVYRPQPPPDPCDLQHIQTEDGQEITLAPPTCY